MSTARRSGAGGTDRSGEAPGQPVTAGQPAALRGAGAARALSGWGVPVLAELPAAAALAAAAAAILFFDITTGRIFEPQKAVLVRSLALLATAAWLSVRLFRPAARPGAGRPGPSSLLGLAALAYLGWNALATLAAPYPDLALWGSFHRVQGLYSLLAYAGLGFFLGRRPAHHRTLLELLTLAGSLAAGYALWQRSGLDTLPWGGDVITRPTATLGNAIFLGALLALSLPTTLTLFISGRHRPERLVWGTGLMVQAAGLTAAASRGPFFASLAGLATVLLLFRGSGRGWAGALLLAGGLVGAGLGQAAPAARLGDPGGPTGQVRALIWQGTAEMLASRPLRLATGYGPEGMLVGFPGYYPPLLGQIENPAAAADRAHNGVWETAATLGLPGLGLWLALWAALLARALGLAGWRVGGRELGLWGGGLLLGGVGAAAWGGPGWLGPGMQAGGLAGWLASLVVGRLLDGRPASGAVLPAAASAALAAHWGELSTGLPIVATSLLFWLLAGTLWSGGAGGGTPPTEPERPGSHTQPLARALLAWLALGSYLGALLPHAEPAAWPGFLPLVGLMALFAAAWALVHLHGRARVEGLQALAALGALALLLLWSAGRLLEAQGLLASPSHTTFLFLLSFGLGLAWFVAEPAEARRVQMRGWVVAATGLFLGLGLLVGLARNLALIEADALQRAAQVAEAEAQPALAGQHYARALRLDSRAASYYVGLARALTASAAASDQPQNLYLSALFLLETAAQMEPYNPDHPLNLARLHAAWTAIAPQAERQDHLRQAIQHYRQAIERKPASYAAQRGLAELLWRDGQREEALEAARAALRLAPPGERIEVRTLLERWEGKPHP